MRKAIQIAGYGAVAIVLYDALTAVISVSTGISYDWFAFGSLLIYFACGYLAARVSKWIFGAMAGALIALAESTLGWAISWAIGPGKLPEEMSIAVMVVGVILMVVPSGALVGLLGGLVTLLYKRDA